MSDIKKTALVILIIAVLSNTFTQYAYAANDYDHDELMQYEGYGKAMYESIVEQTTFISGQYTDNKDYVSNSMDEIKSYADFWYNEYNDFTSSCYQNSAMNCLGEMVERGGAYVLTVGDWIKNLFSGVDEQFNASPSEQYSAYANYFTYSGTYTLSLNSGYKAELINPSGTTWRTLGGGDTIRIAFTYDSYVTNSPIKAVIYQGSANTSVDTGYKFTNNTQYNAYWEELKNINGFFKYYFMTNLGIRITKDNKPVDLSSPASDANIRTINNYIQDGGLDDKTLVLPKLKPSLVCPDGTRIQMVVDGSTFLAVDGTVMLVNKDGTAEVNGSICNLGWQKPTVEYDPDGNVIVTQPDGTETDLTTGDTNTKPPGSDDLEGCSGVLCGIGKLLDGLGSVVSSIADLVKDILDGLLGLFVPEDLDFMTEEFNKITKKLNDKIAITNSLKEAITSVFDGGGSNPLANISINLPITNEPLTFGNVSFIEEGVPILRRVIGAIVVLYTIAYVYRKITGRGGVMER